MKKKNLQRFFFIFIMCAAIALMMYGLTASRYKLYEVRKNNKGSDPFFDWISHREMTIANTFGGIRRDQDDRFVAIPEYRLLLLSDQWKRCPS